MISKASQAKLTELRNSGNWCCLEIKSDFNYVWDIYLIRAARKDGDKHEVTVRSHCHEDLNDAVNEVYEKAQEYLKNETK